MKSLNEALLQYRVYSLVNSIYTVQQNQRITKLKLINYDILYIKYLFSGLMENSNYLKNKLNIYNS